MGRDAPIRALPLARDQASDPPADLLRIQCFLDNPRPRVYPAGMLALLSVWLGFAALAVAALMAVRREWFTDVGIAVALYSAIFSLTFAGLTLWALRKEPTDGPGVAGRRTQCKVGMGLSAAGIIIVYALVHRLAGGG